MLWAAKAGERALLCKCGSLRLCPGLPLTSH